MYELNFCAQILMWSSEQNRNLFVLPKKKKKKTLAQNVPEVEETLIIILHAYSKRPWSVFLPSRHLNVIQIYTNDGLVI